MKVAIIAPTTIPSRRANTVQVMKMTQAFVTIGHQVHLIIPDDPKNARGADRNWDSLAHHYGLKNQFPMVWLPAKSALRKYDYAWKAVRWSRKWEADVIYTRLPQAAAIASYQGHTTVLEIHDRPQGSMGPMLFRLFYRGRGAQRVVAISNALAADLIDNYQDSIESSLIEVLPDGVDLDRYIDLPGPPESRSQLSADLKFLEREINSQFFPDRFTVGYTGHLYPGRGVSMILEIAERIPEVNFLIVGGDPGDVNRVREKVLDHDLKNVLLTGFVPNADLPRYQSACDILLMPYQPQVSASSGGDIGRYLSPMKLFEYLASGRAICSSDLPVLKEILSSEIAVLLPPTDVESWVTAIRELQDNSSYRNNLAHKARLAATEYSWESRAEKILSGIESFES